MKVLQLTQRFPPAIGGVEQHVYHLATGLVRAGVQVEVVTTDLLRNAAFGRVDSSSDSFPFSVTRARTWKMFEAPHGLGFIAPSMLRKTMRSSAEVVHAHAYGYFPTVAGSVVSALDHCVLVITPHSDAGRSSPRKSIFDRVVSPLTLGRASRVIAVSRHEATHLARLGIPREKIRVISNGVDLEEFAGVKRNRQAGDRVRGLFVGRLDPDQKGLETLIRAVALLPSSFPVQIRLIGEDWGATDSLLSLARRLAVGDKVVVVGKVDRPALLREYSAADFLVLPSLFEPFGIVLLEAMASGLPVVASRVGGIPEIVLDGRTGLLVEPGNPRALAEGLVALCQDENRRRLMGMEALAQVTNFGWDSIVPQILLTYREALEEQGG